MAYAQAPEKVPGLVAPPVVAPTSVVPPVPAVPVKKEEMILESARSPRAGAFLLMVAGGVFLTMFLKRRR